MQEIQPTAFPSHAPLAGKRVLIAEDSHAQQRILSFWLRKAGATVTVTEDGREAVERATRELFDAIVLDMQMPQLDGYAAAARLRRQGYRGSILALTGDTFPGDEQRCMEAGCDGYLGKPVEPAMLLGLLIRLLAESSSVAAPSVPTDNVSFQDLLQQYVSGLSERMQQLRAALAADDRPALAQLAHKTRGSAAMYGLPELAELAGLIEAAVREGQDRDLLAELLGELENEARRQGHGSRESY
jgi:CheY-like chemotaxis protein